MPISALTAFHALFQTRKGRLVGGLLTLPPNAQGFEPGFPKPKANGEKRILIIGGAGAVGGMVVQLARLAGAGLVAATCSAKDMDFVKGLGAYLVVDRKDLQTLEKWKHHFHGVIDCVGGEQLKQAFQYVRPDGHLISVVHSPKNYLPDNPDDLASRVSYGFFIVKPSPDRLEAMTVLLRTATLRPIFSPENVLNMDQYLKIIDKMSNKSRGKVVLQIDQREPWDLIEILEKHGVVPELSWHVPEATGSRMRGHTTREILKIYKAAKAMQNKLRDDEKKRKEEKQMLRARVESMKALNPNLDYDDAAAGAAGDADAGPARLP